MALGRQVLQSLRSLLDHHDEGIQVDRIHPLLEFRRLNSSAVPVESVEATRQVVHIVQERIEAAVDVLT